MVSNAAAGAPRRVSTEANSADRTHPTDNSVPRPSVFGQFRRFVNCSDLPETLITVGKLAIAGGLGMIVAGIAVPLVPVSFAGVAVTLAGGALYLTGRVIQAIRKKNRPPEVVINLDPVVLTHVNATDDPETPDPLNPLNPRDPPNPRELPNEPSTADTPHGADNQNDPNDPSTSGTANVRKPNKKIKLPKHQKHKSKTKHFAPTPKPKIQLEKVKSPVEKTTRADLQLLISLMGSQPQMLQQQGIFRVSPSANVTNFIATEMLLSNFDALVTKHGSEEMGNVVAGRIKSCINHCFTPEEKRDFSARNQQMTEGNGEGITPLAEMPELYRSLIELLAKTVVQESVNKMSAKNLEVVLGPNIYDPVDQAQKMQTLMQMQMQKPGAPKPELYKMITMDIETQS